MLPTTFVQEPQKSVADQRTPATTMIFKQAQPAGGCQVCGLTHQEFASLGDLFLSHKKNHQPQQNRQMDWCETSKRNKHLTKNEWYSGLGPNVYIPYRSLGIPCIRNARKVPGYNLGGPSPGPLLESTRIESPTRWVCGQVISNFPWSLRWNRRVPPWVPTESFGRTPAKVPFKTIFRDLCNGTFTLEFNQMYR